jgi:hypothetical protein
MILDGEDAGSRVWGVAKGRLEIGCGGGGGLTLGACCTDDGAVEGVEDLGGEGVDLSVLISPSRKGGIVIGFGRTLVVGATPI